MSRNAESILLKNEGNGFFQRGDYIGADSLYSKACVPSPEPAVDVLNLAD